MRIPIPSENEGLSPEEELEILRAMAKDAQDQAAKDRANRIFNDYLRSLPKQRSYNIMRKMFGL